MRRLSAIAITGKLAMLWCGVVSTSALAQAAWNAATGYPEKYYHTLNIRQFAQEVAAATQGKLQIAVHADASLFKQNQIKEAIQAGKVEMGEVLFASMGKEMPIMGADSVPFVVASYADARRLWSLQRPKTDEDFAAHGLRMLFSVPWPPQALFTYKPIKRASDMKGLRVRAQNQTIARIAELWGATPVTDVPTNELERALEVGKVNTLITSAVTGVESKAWEYLKYVYTINAWIPRNAFLVNAKAFTTLDLGVQRAVLQAAAAAEERGWLMSAEANTQALSDLRQNGMKVEPTPFEFEQDLARIGERFTREWIRQAGHRANDIFLPYYGGR